MQSFAEEKLRSHARVQLLHQATSCVTVFEDIAAYINIRLVHILRDMLIASLFLQHRCQTQEKQEEACSNERTKN